MMCKHAEYYIKTSSRCFPVLESRQEITAAEMQSLLDATDRGTVWGPTATLFFGASTLDEVVAGIATEAQQYRNLRSRDRGALSRSLLSDTDFQKMQSALSHEAMNADVAPIQRAVNSWSTVVGAAGTAARAYNSLRSVSIAPGRRGAFLSDADLLRARLGPAEVSHADEYASILRQLREAEVDIDFRPGSLAYSPTRGGPGRIILDPDASMGAVRHEFRHFLDIQEAGFPGMGPYLANPKEFWRLEFRGYMEEINLARQLRDFETGRKIVEQMRARRLELLQIPGGW